MNDMAESRQIKRLRRVIPEVEGCMRGCTECCGPVPFSKWEWGHLKDKRNIPGHGGMCPYIEDGKCAIYKERPILCRLFGTGNQARYLTCKKGARIGRHTPTYSPEGIFVQYRNILDETGVCGPFAELFAEIHLLTSIGRLPR